MTAVQQSSTRRPVGRRRWLWVAAVAVLLVAAAVAATLLLIHRAKPSLSFADRQACDALEKWGLSAADGDQNADEMLYVDLQDAAPGGGLSPDLAPYAQIVDASALLVKTGGQSPRFSEYVGQMRGVCESLGWRSQGS